MRRISYIILGLALLTACSTTKHLPEGETLYGGVKEIVETTHDTVPAEVTSAVKATLEVPPNGSLLKSAYKRTPFRFGLWMYNLLYPKKETGFKHWLWSRLKSDPILISEVNPDLRSRAAQVAMADEGYFNGTVEWDTLTNPKRPREAKVRYKVSYPKAKYISDVQWMRTGEPAVDSLIEAWKPQSLIRKGERYRALNLEAEQLLFTNNMKAAGYYYYKNSYIRYLADSTLSSQGIALRIHVDHNAVDHPDTSGIVMRPLRPAVIDSVSFDLSFGYGDANRFDTIDFIAVGYRGRQRLKDKHIRRLFPFTKGVLYHPDLVTTTKSKISRLNTFRYSNVTFRPLPSNDSINHLLMDVNVTYAYPWYSSMEMNFVVKDNDQLGPGLNWSVQRRNLFGGGELLRLELTAAYQWNTGNRLPNSSHNLLNSYEFGLKPSIVIPRLQMPRFFRTSHEYPVSTTYSLSANVQRRSGYFQMMRLSGEVKYDFYTTVVSSHSFSPIKLSYVRITDSSSKFDSLLSNNRVLAQTYQNQFIPKMEYSYTFDNRDIREGKSSQQWLQLTVAEAGGIINTLQAWWTNNPSGQRKLLWQPFSQFLKGTVDFRNYWHVNSALTLATRLFGGVAWAYGNSKYVPFSEQFYIGGANSLRGFSIRSVGPGTFVPTDNTYGYMDQTGDIKLEANVELRFPLIGSLNGALFADAGNVWTLNKDDSRRDGQISSDFFRQIATDVGLGLRYDLGMLVVRFDWGIPLHDPGQGNDTYFNIGGNFFSGCGYHLAIGYPF